MTYKVIYKTFIEVLNLPNWEPIAIYEQEFNRISSAIGFPKNCSKERFKTILCNVINDKLSLNNNAIKEKIDLLGCRGVFLNYHEKNLLQRCFIQREITPFISLLKKKKISGNIISDIKSISFDSDNEILNQWNECISKDEKWKDIVDSVFACLLHSLFNVEDIDNYYSGSDYNNSRFYDFLKRKYPLKYDRGHALSVLHISESLYRSYKDYDSALTAILQYISKEYDKLQNYCYTSIVIDNIKDNCNSITWRLYSDIVLYACKFKEEHLKCGYFHPTKIEEITTSYIPHINKSKANFEIANTGFTYKDCIIISNGAICYEGESSDSPYQILLLFQKNMRDEDIIPCPCCKSTNVRGNSYPTLGVKSWECNNPLCPDKSKYNRGKRYSMSSIIKQEAIEDNRGLIDKAFLNEWRLDVVGGKTMNNILEYLIREYSFVDDSIILVNIPTEHTRLYDREVICIDFEYKPDLKYLSFYKSAFFERFAIIAPPTKKEKIFNVSNIDGLTIYNGNCRNILASINECSFDGAITSPPYYNAKSYSHWDNIYCYLYDMYNQAKEVYRTLKDGSYYLYNIFDYFDNENNIVFSAMGQGRMILGAYIIYLFRKLGFEIQDNIIWYKGHIQGHRSTNQGNNSPYYQAPLNCYEHILCFRKPSTQKDYIQFPSIVNIFPVVKMVKGKNVLGHSAPFPQSIPELLISRIQEGCILEPYAGSFTTARAARRKGLSSVNVEMSKEYCELGLKLIEQE